MNRNLKIVLNAMIFLLIGGFVWYIVASINKAEVTYIALHSEADRTFVSAYEFVTDFILPEEVNRFEYNDEKLFIAAGNNIYVYNANGEKQTSFAVKPDVRDIAVEGEVIYVLYPTFIEVYSQQGDSLHQWEACSDLSDYCSLAIAGDFVFVTDAENKNICKYTKEGYFVKFIQSPRGFVIPSYSFDIVSRNDTIFCSNAGRHLVESYTLDGDFIAAFGGPGGESGFFAGCCNPSFLTFTSDGRMLTSEKGNPRISSYERNGNFGEVLLNSRLLGGGSNAYEMRSIDNLLYVAGKHKISVFKQKDSLAKI